MAALTNIQKVALVEALAGFMRPADVTVYMREEHEVELTIAQVVKYDPSKPSYTAGDDLRAIFEAARKNCIENIQATPIANQGYRLTMLQSLLDKAVKDNKPSLAAELLEQAAKEVGGILTNERNVKLERSTSPLAELSPDERRAMVADMFRSVIEANKQKQQTITVEATTDEKHS